ncbi:MAG TPA: PTS system mannose/fructose/sorbose family transporter subunit IID [Candidatus Krumholzibacteria bacterium]|nr:PTS system mannose/fructose/sorbose family transporter subunit IID [Candidatus Krumholzibacteria bacterium]
MRRGRSGMAAISWWRLWSVQGSFSPSRRQWLGWIVALEPTREEAARPDADWVRAEPGVVNTNPFLFGVLAGARVAVDEQGNRDLARALTETLPSTLGALGDRLVWTGLRPAVMVWAAVAALWAGPWAALVAWAVLGIGQGWLRHWGLRWGYVQGPAIGLALRRLPLHALADRFRRAGAVGAGVLAASLLGSGAGPTIAEFPLSTAGATAMVAVLAWKRSGPEWALLSVGLLVWAVTRLQG